MKNKIISDVTYVQCTGKRFFPGMVRTTIYTWLLRVVFFCHECFEKSRNDSFVDLCQGMFIFLNWFISFNMTLIRYSS